MHILKFREKIFVQHRNAQKCIKFVLKYLKNEAYFKEKNIINYLYKNNNLKIEIVSKAT